MRPLLPNIRPKTLSTPVTTGASLFEDAREVYPRTTAHSSARKFRIVSLSFLLFVQPTPAPVTRTKDNGGVERVIRMAAHMLAVVGNERRDDWEAQLPHGKPPTQFGHPRNRAISQHSPWIGIHGSFSRFSNTSGSPNSKFCVPRSARTSRLGDKSPDTLVRHGSRETPSAVSRVSNREPARSYALHQVSQFVGDWTGYNIRPARTRASLRSFFRSNNVPLLKLSRLAPSPSLSATHRTVFSRHQISYILDLPLYIPGVDAYRRVSVSRCFPVRILTMVMTLRIIFRHG